MLEVPSPLLVVCSKTHLKPGIAFSIAVDNLSARGNTTALGLAKVSEDKHNKPSKAQGTVINAAFLSEMMKSTLVSKGFLGLNESVAGMGRIFICVVCPSFRQPHR